MNTKLTQTYHTTYQNISETRKGSAIIEEFLLVLQVSLLVLNVLRSNGQLAVADTITVILE